MSDPISLRNIPSSALQLAHTLSKQTGLSINAIFRLALASGLLVEATKVAPDHAGTYGGLDGAYLARALRRHLGSAIDLLLEYGQHPYQGAINKEKGEDAPRPTHQESSPQTTAGNAVVFDSSLGDDLEALGIGLGLSEITE